MVHGHRPVFFLSPPHRDAGQPPGNQPLVWGHSTFLSRPPHGQVLWRVFGHRASVLSHGVHAWRGPGAVPQARAEALCHGWCAGDRATPNPTNTNTLVYFSLVCVCGLALRRTPGVCRGSYAFVKDRMGQTRGHTWVCHNLGTLFGVVFKGSQRDTTR